MKLVTLYKAASSGATQVLDMEIIGDTYTRTWGQLGGAMQTKSTTAKPKNVGRANETSAGAQAIIEAEAVWVKKQKANYSTSITAPVSVDLPMKVHKYFDFKHKVNFETDIVYESPKLNGINAEYRLVDGEVIHLSRGGERYPIPAHQLEYIHQAFEQLGVDRINGEQYIHGEHLQDIQSAVTKTNELSARLIFYVFDLPMFNGTYTDKVKVLEGLDTLYFQSVPIRKVTSHAELDERHTQYIKDGMEGLMVRNGKGIYEYNKRTYDVLKYKIPIDAEFQVYSHIIDKNGHAVFICDVGNGNENTFKVKLKGTAEARLEMAANAKSYYGKWLKTEFETYSKAGVPLKPVGIMFRKCDAEGNPTE